MKSLIFIFLIFSSGQLAYGKMSSCSTKSIATFNNQKASYSEKADFYSCLADKKLYSASIPFLIHLISTSNSKDFQNKYLPVVLKDLPRTYNERLFKKLYKKRMTLSPEVKSDLMYFFALRSFDKGNTKTALRYLSEQKGAGFNRYAQSKFLKGVIYFKKNQVTSAEAQFELLSRGDFKAPNKELKKNILNSSLLNLARIQIIKEDYKDAIESYRKVSFQDSQWFDGLIEMSWVMLSKNDYEGAIGNAEFIDKSTNPVVYKPWVSIVQSIGLLKMCQFPEANKSVESFQKIYENLDKDMNSYVTRNYRKSWYSALVTTLETKLSKSSIKKIPSVVFYAARDSKVIGMQERINDLLDEEDALKTFKRKLKYKNKGFAYYLIDRKINQMSPQVGALENKAGLLFKDKLFTALDEHKSLQKIADIVDFEVFSRSSKSITNRVAGAKFKDKMKRANRKQSSWAYVGEFWTDEVGKFRSFVKNKCIDEDLKVSKK